jgi:hypothetical protein
MFVFISGRVKLALEAARKNIVQSVALRGKLSSTIFGSAPMSVDLPPTGRDLRLDFFRGVANWWIFLDHIPNNVVSWITPRNYGFSDAADLFVFISGYTASFVYARIMLDRGFIVGTSRLLRRTWQIYVAHVLLVCRVLPSNRLNR